MVTEAEGLFRAGALYRRRLGLRRSADSLVMAGFKPGGFSIYRDDSPFLHFDLEGRWQRCLIEGPHLVKSLGNDVVEIDRVRQGVNLVLKRRSLNPDEIRALDNRIRDEVRSLRDDLQAGRLEVHPPPAMGEPLPVEELIRFLETIESWDDGAWLAHRQRFESAYSAGLPSFVPPDLGTAVVLDGMAEDFAGHAERVARLLGARVAQSRIVFLGGADVLPSQPDRIAERLEIVARRFPMALGTDRRHVRHQALEDHRFQAMHASLDRFAAILSTPEDWKRLQSLGLAKIHLEIESGAPAIRASANRPLYENQQLQATVRDLKSAGIDLGLVIPLAPDAAATADIAESHLVETADLLGGLELGPRDIVSLAIRGDTAPETFVDRQAAFRQALQPIIAERRFKLAFPMLETA